MPLLEVAAVDAVADRGTYYMVAAVDPCSPFRDGIPCRDGSPCCKLHVCRNLDSEVEWVGIWLVYPYHRTMLRIVSLWSRWLSVCHRCILAVLLLPPSMPNPFDKKSLKPFKNLQQNLMTGLSSQIFLQEQARGGDPPADDGRVHGAQGGHPQPGARVLRDALHKVPRRHHRLRPHRHRTLQGPQLQVSYWF